METILDKVKKEDVIPEPFPHIIIRNVISDDLCSRLIDEMPSMDVLTLGRPIKSNERFHYKISDVFKNDAFSLTWQEFVKLHVSDQFLERFIHIFDDHIAKIYPDLQKKWTDRIPKAGVTGIDSFQTADVLLDCAPCVNTPVTDKPNSVKIAHLDNPHKLFAGLFYLRFPGDDSEGGDLELYRYKTNNPKFHGARLIDKRYVEKVSTVKYEKNALVLFLNTFDAIHGVTPRSITKYPRYFTNFYGEIENPLFDLALHRENILNKAVRRFF